MRLRPPSLRLPRFPLILLLAGLLVCLAGPADAKRPARRHARVTPSVTAPRASALPSTPRPATPVVVRGMVVAVDPETGALVLPTPEQRLRLTPAERTGLLRTSSGLAEQRLPDGSVMVDLQGRFREFTVVQAGPSGVLRLGCVHDQAALRRLLQPAAPVPTPTFVEK